jgi:ABC-type lipoprotein export system ATPase subunit
VTVVEKSRVTDGAAAREPSTVVRGVGISKSYGSATILSGLDFEVSTGESVAVMGPSGSGKSTLLSILGLLAHPSEGAVHLFGAPAPTDDRSRSALRRSRMSWVFQRAALLRSRSALDNVAFALVMRGETRLSAEQQAHDYLDLVGLGRRAEVEARHLSGGEQQRLEIARAMSRQTELLLCDEPTASLDRRNAEEVAELLVALKPPRTSILFATHDPVVSERCDRILLLVDGHIVRV